MRGSSSLAHPVLILGPDDRGVIEKLLSTPCAETFSEVPESAMLPDEEAVVARATARRRQEFGSVRHCARTALMDLGVAPVPLLPDADGAPRWPDGVIGSMTHCTGYRAAAVAPAARLRALGIDAEPHAALPVDTLDLVLRAEERTALALLSGDRPELHWDRIVFCVKEAVYKAWFPSTRTWLDFTDVLCSVDVTGTFRAVVRARAPGATGLGLSRMSGRWSVDRDLVVATTAVARGTANGHE